MSIALDIRSDSAEEYREIAKQLLFSADVEEEDKDQGIKYLLKAYRMKDPEASFLVAKLVLQGALKPVSGDQEEQALSILCGLADGGYVDARKMLNSICDSRYEALNASGKTPEREKEGLYDFDGKPIRINRKGVFSPIDAVLKYENGENVLTLSANLNILCSEEVRDEERFTDAVLKGIMEWEGVYTVFGGQRLRVEMKLTQEFKLFDTVFVLTLNDDFGNNMLKIRETLYPKASNEWLRDIVENKRSFAVNGVKWSAYSRKIIYILSKDKTFGNYDEIQAVAKHEFGHALGLGDLYAEPERKLAGVQKGTYRELDGYYVSNLLYNLVMCDHHGPISNNDIEMVVLAFRDNVMQLYQPANFKGKISEALGKGN